eukprot:77348-Chlamydomonas_euryale.AAC.3
MHVPTCTSGMFRHARGVGVDTWRVNMAHRGVAMVGHVHPPMVWEHGPPWCGNMAHPPNTQMCPPTRQSCCMPQPLVGRCTAKQHA